MTHLKVGYAYISIFLTPSYCGRVYDRRTTGVKTLAAAATSPSPRAERTHHYLPAGFYYHKRSPFYSQHWRYRGQNKRRQGPGSLGLSNALLIFPNTFCKHFCTREVYILLSLQAHNAEPLGFNMSSAQKQPATSQKQRGLLPQPRGQGHAHAQNNFRSTP